MCTIYNTIGSLNTIKRELQLKGIDDFKSVRELMDYRRDYYRNVQKAIEEHEALLKQEIRDLELELQELKNVIHVTRQASELNAIEEINNLHIELKELIDQRPTNVLTFLKRAFQRWSIERKINQKERERYSNAKGALSQLNDDLAQKSNRHSFISTQFNEAVNQSAKNALNEIERKMEAISDLQTFIYGAIGEHKVVKTLEILPNEFHLINDFSISFRYPIYYKPDHSHIKSIQIDHLLVAPSGLFVIEAKNWSADSVINRNLRSPVQQIKRASYALYKILNAQISNHQLTIGDHHWGEIKIPFRNVIALTNSKPKEEFQHVKVLTMAELPSYIQYFKPIFSAQETGRIADFLLRINNQGTI